MKNFIALVLIFSCFSAFAQQDNRITIGTSDTIYSKILNEKRAILVHVPHGDKDQRYPVLYILDGETHFQSAVAIDEQLSGVLPDLIIVGITNTVRERDLTPTAVKDQGGSGGGENFMGFIEKELMPYIDTHYPTAPYRVLSGHSLGGLTVMNAFFNHNSLFNAYIAIDPSIWWEGQQWIKRQETGLQKLDLNNKSLFVAIANNIPAGLDTNTVQNDKSGRSLVTQAVFPFVHYLKDQHPKGLRWTYKFYPTERHGTVELAAEYDALHYLFDFYHFGTDQFIGHPELDEDAVIAAHFKMVSERLGYKVSPTEDLINEMGYDCMARHKMDVAGKLFKRNTDEHPNSANAFDSLGDYYRDAGDKQKAIEAYAKSLSLHETTDTRSKMEALKRNK